MREIEREKERRKEREREQIGSERESIYIKKIVSTCIDKRESSFQY